MMNWLPWKKTKETDVDFVPARDPFLARPVVMPGVESAKDSLGLIQIRRRSEPKGKFTRSLSRIFKMHYAMRVKLDKAGSVFWALIDGQRTLGDITGTMEGELAWTSAESRQATIEFTAMLMKRELIALQIDKTDSGCPVTAENKMR